MNPLQFREVIAWVMSGLTSVNPDGLRSFNRQRHIQFLASLWEGYGYSPEDVVVEDGWPRCLLFEQDLSPRFVSVEITHAQGAARQALLGRGRKGQTQPMTLQQ
jgi:hypothetical protein